MDVPEICRVPRAADRRRRAWLSVVVLSWGALAIVTQSLLLREALVLMFGSEFAWGVVLFAWLLGVALGAVVGGWTGERLRRPQVALVAVLLTLSAAACVELWLFRGARAWLGVEPGELLPLPQTALVAMLFASPAGALVGIAFPLACCIGRGDEPRASARAALTDKLRSTAAGCLSFGRVYALESAGSLIGVQLLGGGAPEPHSDSFAVRRRYGGGLGRIAGRAGLGGPASQKRGGRSPCRVW